MKDIHCIKTEHCAKTFRFGCTFNRMTVCVTEIALSGGNKRLCLVCKAQVLIQLSGLSVTDFN